MSGSNLRSLVMVPALLAALGIPAARAQQGPGPLDRVLSAEARQAFASATRDPELWQLAQRDGSAYMKKMGVHVPEDVAVEFLDLQRFGDRLQFQRPGEQLDMYCPRERSWFFECSKIIRACDVQTVCVHVELDQSGWHCTEEGQVNTNCGFVCEQFIWDEKYVGATRPFYPPLPRAAGR